MSVPARVSLPEMLLGFNALSVPYLSLLLAYPVVRHTCNCITYLMDGPRQFRAQA